MKSEMRMRRLLGVVVCRSCAPVHRIATPPSVLTVNGGHGILLVDFDVSKSFSHPGANASRWMLVPSPKATPVRLAGSVQRSRGRRDRRVMGRNCRRV
jgi:hypothetical protein